MTKIFHFPYPIYDLSKNLIPYLCPDPKINSLFQTCLKIISLVQTNVEGNIYLLFCGWKGGHNEEVASSKKKKKRNSSLECKNPSPIYDQNGAEMAKIPCTPSFLSLSNSFCRGIQSKAFLKSTKHEKSKFWRFCGLDLTYLSISIFNVKMLSTVPCIFLKPPNSAFKIPF